MLITSLGTAFAGAAVWSVAGMVALGSTTAFVPGQLAPKPHPQTLKQAAVYAPVAYVSTDKSARPVISRLPAMVSASITGSIGKSARHAQVVAVVAKPTRFDTVVKQAALTPAKLASLFQQTDPAKAQDVAAAGPAQPAQHQTLLAYADPTPGGASDAAGTALSTLLVGPNGEDLTAPAPEVEVNAAAIVPVPDFEDTPSAAPLPQLRPSVEQAEVKPEAPTEAKTETAKVEEVVPAKPQVVAYARPDTPAEKKSSGTIGQTLRNLFGGNGSGSGIRAGGGVAVYDISAAKVYMPDGSVLEAHSGIGNMADNPRYVNVKMNGPTPPHTYNLKMRESRFHGVEAVRMLPVDGKNKYGRDGFLTHSYLLRGGREESHGCVAFADYPRFLAAFKAGKVKQMVVVPSGGRETFRLASNGKTI